jgi:hypothetical protein
VGTSGSLARREIGVASTQQTAASVRPYCHTDHYWQVYFAVNEVLKKDLAVFPAPMPTQLVDVRQVTNGVMREGGRQVAE